jgi:hypothetical protein
VGVIVIAGHLLSPLVRLRHKMQKPSDDAAFERLKDWLFCRKSPHALGLRLVCDAVVLGKRFSIAVVSCQVSSSLLVHFPTVIVHRLARFSLLSEVGALAAT